MRVEDYLVWRIEDIADQDDGRRTIYSVVNCIDAEKLDELKGACQKEDSQFNVRFFKGQSEFTFLLFFNNGLFSKVVNEKDGDGDDDLLIYVPAYVFTDIAVRIIAAVALQLTDSNYLKRHLLGQELGV